jgi:hypothetical protein
MLEMRPGCECCDKDLAADSGGAMICSFECTFCERCAADVLHGVCPNCGGGLTPRPVRPTAKLGGAPDGRERVFNPNCRAMGQMA